LAQFIDDHLIEMVAPPATKATAAWIEKMFGKVGSSNTHVLIRGPQGCGKSTKTMTKIPTIYENDPGVIFFSSPSIQQAEEKIDTFERVNKDENSSRTCTCPSRRSMNVFAPYRIGSITSIF
jgi:hypothetical protein